MDFKRLLIKNLFVVRVPRWFIILLVLCLVFAYGDLIIRGHNIFAWYLYASILEIILIFIGFTIAYNTQKIEMGDRSE